MTKWHCGIAKTRGWHCNLANFGHLVAPFSLQKITNKQYWPSLFWRETNPPTVHVYQVPCLELCDSGHFIDVAAQKKALDVSKLCSLWCAPVRMHSVLARACVSPGGFAQHGHRLEDGLHQVGLGAVWHWEMVNDYEMTTVEEICWI